MVATDTPLRPLGLRFDDYGAVEHELGLVDVPAPRRSSLQISWACMQYAASVRYQKVMLRDLCLASGVSERRVREAFCECHGMSPTAYLRVAGLLEVRRALLGHPEVRDAVTRAASDFGFWHLGRFAGQYRALFGESPSETVARARAARDSKVPNLDSSTNRDTVLSMA